MAAIRLLVGLGNIGAQYTQTRHNSGFHLIDALAESQRIHLAPQSKFLGEIARLQLPALNGHDLWLLKPATLMNRSGSAVAALARFHKISPEEILIAHDELDLAPGTVRLKQGGGHGGHNGLRDTIAQLGSREFLRLRLGIGHPGDSSLVTNYVLGRAPASERTLCEAAITAIIAELNDIICGNYQAVMNRLHTIKP
ncbi:MAG: aminoacyl-tRNA hydrolase [Gammaproteobacteria bacterium]|nr:aminoacyl-tRNA hydrolase [Gammaproteobacteria bacterium]